MMSERGGEIGKRFLRELLDNFGIIGQQVIFE